MQPLLFYKISISYHISQGKKRGFEKNYKINFLPYSLPWKEEVGGKAARRGFPLPGSTINLFSKIFLPGTRHSPNSLTRIIFTRHTAQERPPKKIRRIFVPLFPKTHRRSLIFAQTGTFPTAISEKGYKRKRNLIFFCAMCQVFFCPFYIFRPSPRAPAKK